VFQNENSIVTCDTLLPGLTRLPTLQFSCTLMYYEVEVLLTGLQLSQWIALASTTLLLHDHAINLADEVSCGVDSSYPNST
jgi:hypothetical protein